MTPERWQDIERILDRALERSPEEWPALLDDACAGDAALRSEVEALLEHQEHLAGFLETPPTPPDEPASSPPSDERMNDPLVGKEVDDYRIEAVLGRGGMGVVYQAEDTALSREVALKRINPELASDETFLRRFRSEARALARIDSSFITRVHALRNTDAGLFIVMEYVEGGTLADVRDEGPMDETEARALIEQMLRAFEAAHGAGVIHRDIKPQNIMLTPEGRVKVTDFGLARMRQRDAKATVTQGTAGTLNYMSPEQVEGRADLDHRTDLFSLGTTCYELLAGRLPFDRDSSEFAKMQAIVEEEFPSLRQFRPGVSEALAGIIMKALAKDPDRRFQSASAMREAVEALGRNGDGGGGGKDTRAARPRAAAVASSSSSRTAWIVAGALVLLLLLGGGGYYLLASGSPSAGTAQVSISTVPAGATVSLNGKTVDKTPLRGYPVAAGSLSVLVHKSGYIPLDTTLTLRAGRSARLADLKLAERASLARAGAEEETPQGENDGPDETPSSASPSTAAASTPEPDPTPAASKPAPKPSAPAPATLTLSAAASVTASVGGQRKSGGGDFQVTPGRHTARCRHPQYGTLKKTLTFSAGQSRTLACHFEQTINVNTDGAWGNIWVNGTNTGLSTPNEIQRGPGTYQIEVRIERSNAYTISGGNQRTTVGSSSSMDSFSGSTATVNVEAGFTQTKHSLVFQVKGGAR